MSPSTRRTHTKSRHGCQQCKKNRTKCDERKPSCTRCARTGVKCSLADPTSALIVISDFRVKKTDSGKDAEQAPCSVTSAGSGSPLPSPPPSRKTAEPGLAPMIHSNDLPGPEHELERLVLVAHYCQSTWQTISKLTLNSDEGQALWQLSVVELAFHHDFLLQGLLSISALHQALCKPESWHENHIKAVRYHIRGIALFNPHLANMAADNIDALFAFACLTALYSFGIHLERGSQLSPLVKIHEVYTMIRGTSVIVQGGFKWLESGIWSPWLRGRKDVEEKLADEIEEMLAELTSRVNTTITTSSQSTAYYATIGALRRNFVQANARPRNQMSLVLFPIFSPPEFLEMVCIGEPLALAILANWAVILHWLRGHIWIQFWGRQTIEAVHEVLPDNWHDCIAWALGELAGPNNSPSNEHESMSLDTDTASET